MAVQLRGGRFLLNLPNKGWGILRKSVLLFSTLRRLGEVFGNRGLHKGHATGERLVDLPRAASLDLSCGF
jgi:hypothetical protein